MILKVFLRAVRVQRKEMFVFCNENKIKYFFFCIYLSHMFFFFDKVSTSFLRHVEWNNSEKLVNEAHWNGRDLWVRVNKGVLDADKYFWFTFVVCSVLLHQL